LRVELDREPHVAVLSFLTRRQLLLIVDNCEHLVEASAELVRALLQRCAGVTVLVTTREPLGVEGETLLRLGPLDEAAATRLFRDRPTPNGRSSAAEMRRSQSKCVLRSTACRWRLNWQPRG
jgi:predicted ATPase